MSSCTQTNILKNQMLNESFYVELPYREVDFFKKFAKLEVGTIKKDLLK